MRLKCAILFTACAFLSVSACSRTGLWQLIPEGEESSGGRAGRGSGGSGGKAPECVVAEDCPIVDLCAPPACVTPTTGGAARCEARPIACDDGDPCTLDRCEPASGSCEHERPVDVDGDGHLGEPPAGAPASCGGADCDDHDANVHPGMFDVCNGKDDDCNGAIDENDDYQVVEAQVALAPEAERSQHGGIAYSDGGYGVTYSSITAGNPRLSSFGLLDLTGLRAIEPVLVSDINADTYAGTLAWSGSAFLTAWSDARQGGDYEIYSTRFDTEGNKLSPDQRLTNATGKSLRPVLRFAGSEYLVVWDDRRFEDVGGETAIYGRRLSEGGATLGDEVRLTADGEAAEFGVIAVGEERVALTYIVKGLPGANASGVRVRTVDHLLADASGAVELSNDATEASIVALRDGFLVAWATGSEARGWGSQIQAAKLDTMGNVLESGPVTSGDRLARWRTLVSLGDRAVLIWSGLGDGGVYSLYYQVFAGLRPVSERKLLAASAAGGALMDPIATLGPNGDIGVLYDENRNGLFTAYFARLACSLTLR